MDAATLYGPAAAPPPGVLPNFVNPPNGSNFGIAMTILMTSISGLCVLIRAYSRVYRAKKLSVADGFEIAAFGFYIGMLWCGVSLWKLFGFFTHQYNVRLITLFDALYITYIFPLMYAFTMMCAKTAILLEWLHIFVPHRTRNTFFWTCWAMIVVNVLFYIASCIAVQFYCTPVEKNWHRWIPGTCRDRSEIDTTPSVFNLVFDLLILILPQRVIWKLQMRTRQKIGVSFIFSMGLLACVCAAGRIHQTATLRYATDITYDIGAVYLWALAESTCAIMVFCVPAFPKAFKDFELPSTLRNSLRSWTSSYIWPTKASNSSLGDRTWNSKHSETAVLPSKVYHRMVDDKSNQEIPLTSVQIATPDPTFARDDHYQYPYHAH